ncbi:hypothetical protein [Spirochaeta dissipatitropha]
MKKNLVWMLLSIVFAAALVFTGCPNDFLTDETPVGETPAEESPAEESPAEETPEPADSTAGLIGIDASIDPWGSGTAIVTYENDPYYNSVLQLTSGFGWNIDAVAAGFVGIVPGTLSQFETLEFKVKSDDVDSIKVQMTGAENAELEFDFVKGEESQELYEVTELEGGWVQMTIDLDVFGIRAVDQVQFGILLQNASGVVYLADIQFTGEVAPDTAVLDARIEAAQALNGAHVVGEEGGDVPQAAKDDFTAAIAAAEAAAVSTWIEIAAAYIELSAAMGDFQSAVIIPPPEAKPAEPTQDAADVYAFYSATYGATDLPALAGWSGGGAAIEIVELEDESNVLKLSGSNFWAGFEGVSLNATDPEKTHFRIDVWNINADQFRIKLVNFGDPNTEHELIFTGDDLPTGEWISFDLNLNDFAGMTSRDNIQQLIISSTSENAVFFIDNIYFY